MTNTPSELRNGLRNGSNELKTNRYVGVQYDSKTSSVSLNTQKDSSAQLIPGSPSSTKSDDVFEENIKLPPQVSLAKRPSEAEVDDALAKRRASSPVIENPGYRDSEESPYENPYTPVITTLPAQGRKSRKVKHDARIDNKQMMGGGTENVMSLKLPTSLMPKAVEKSEYALPQDAVNNENNYALPQDAIRGVTADSTAAIGGMTAASAATEMYEEIIPSVTGKDINQKRSFFDIFRGGKKKKKQRVKSASAIKADSQGKRAARPGIKQPGGRDRSRSLPGKRQPMDSITETEAGEYETVEIRPSSCSQQNSGMNIEAQYEVVDLKSRFYKQLQFTESQELREKTRQEYEHIGLTQEQTVQGAEDEGIIRVQHDTEIVDGDELAQAHPSKPVTYSVVDLDKKKKNREAKAKTAVGYTECLEDPDSSSKTLQQQDADLQLAS